ncbi:MAG: LysR family transcriptional regulator [Hyphomonadaceae bacterium]|nr:LysR family transcriptional regulator [Hyphomonadaceae bacterium]
MDRLEAMRVAVAVADAGGLSAAGRSLAMPLATVSRKVAELEASVRTQIFQRAGRGLKVTDAGAAYLDACRKILGDVADAERAAAGEYVAPQGVITVAAPVVFGRLRLLPLLPGFLAAYPLVDVRLTLADRYVDLAEEHVDAAVRIGDLPDSALRSMRIGETRRAACASPDYIARRGAPASPADLAAHECVTFDRIDARDNWTFENHGRPVEVRVRSRISVSTAEAAIDCAVAGVGITRVLCYQIADHLRAGRLTRLLNAFEPPPSPVHLIYPGGGRVPMKLRAFLDYVAPRLRQTLAGQS